ncbi:MAG TPA: hypothetical protein DCM05_10185 [Elusimicrobia bacterium]|nr:hypothetical protein [Elusimicrobiota bacterium]
MKKLFFYGLGACLTVGLAVLVVMVLKLGTLVKTAVETLGPKVTRTEVRLKSVTLSPFSGSGKIRGLFIGNPAGFKSGSAFKLDSVRVSVDLKSLRTDRVFIKEIVVDGPEVTYEGSLSGSNLARLQKNVESYAPAAPEPKEAEPGKPMKVEIGLFKVTNGKVNLGLSALGGKGVTVPLPDIELRDIGRESGGVSADEAAKKMLGALNGAALKAAGGSSSLLKSGTDALDGAKKAALGAVKGIFGGTK